MGVGYLTGQGGGGSNIKSIQTGVATWANTLTQQDIIISSVDQNSCLATIDYLSYTNATSVATAIEILNSTTIRLTRNSGVNISTSPFYWVVVEFKNVKSRQAGSALITTSSPTTGTVVNVSSVNINKSILYISHICSITNDGVDYYRLASRIKSATSIELFSGTPNANTAKWQLIEFK